MDNKKRGGKRQGSGRKPTNKPTETLSFRVPKAKKEHYKKVIKLLIEAGENSNVANLLQNKV